MKVDGALLAGVEAAAAQAQEIEAMGYDGAFTLEGAHDPFLPLLLAAEHTRHLELATGIAVAFSRSPMHLANLGWDLQSFSKGRFILGLGSQVKAHVEKRFSAQFSRPAARMRELILAIRAIWHCWEMGEKLDFRGEFYTHTLMTPIFNPGRNPYGNPKIYLGALGERMTEVAGEVADGLLVHPFHTSRYVREYQLPAVERGRTNSKLTQKSFDFSVAVMTITGRSVAERAQAKLHIRRLLAFYASTPAYRPPLDAMGRGDLQPRLNAMSKQGLWNEMAELMDDELVEAFAVCGTPSEIPALIYKRVGDFATRVSLYAPYPTDPTLWPEIVTGLKALP